MSGFSPEWLALREPVDHRSRCPKLAASLAAEFSGKSQVSVVDLGCGSGSNIRATSALLPAEQDWTLVDYDPRLLAAARERLATWADRCDTSGNGLELHHGGRRLKVDFKQADLNSDLDRALGHAPDLVTASAFFDLCSDAFIQRFAAAVAKRKSAFFTVLTYNGEQDWTPGHTADAAMRDAFKAHQLGDKGFGPAAGWMAPKALAAAFQSLGYQCVEGDSPWRLGAKDRQLIADLATGFAGAVGETGSVKGDIIADWVRIERFEALVGHTDTFAQPAKGSHR